MGGQNPERRPLSVEDSQSISAWARDKSSWQILVLCRACAHTGVLTVQALQRHRKPPCCIKNLKSRLYCSKCHTRDFDLHPRLSGGNTR